MFCLSAGPVNAMRQLPPYVPISLVGCSTSGCSGNRCSTGGSLPNLTCSASTGDSLNCLGILAGSSTTCGRLPPPVPACPAGTVCAAAVAAGLAVAWAAPPACAAAVGVAAPACAPAVGFGAAGAVVGA